jgi:hypothetical protein
VKRKCGMTKETSRKGGKSEESEVRKGKRKAGTGEDEAEEAEWRMRMEDKMAGMEMALKRIEAALKTGFGKVMARIKELEENLETETETEDDGKGKKDDDEPMEEEEVRDEVGGDVEME